jgi:hypothetical protein
MPGWVSVRVVSDTLTPTARVMVALDGLEQRFSFHRDLACVADDHDVIFAKTGSDGLRGHAIGRAIELPADLFDEVVFAPVLRLWPADLRGAGTGVAVSAAVSRSPMDPMSVSAPATQLADNQTGQQVAP